MQNSLFEIPQLNEPHQQAYSQCNVIGSLSDCQNKYKVIYADPAWRFSQGINRRSYVRDKFGTDEELSLQYPTMSEAEIINLNVSNIADDDCVLFIWTTDAHLEVAIKAINN